MSLETAPSLGAVNIDRGAARGNLQIVRLKFCKFFLEILCLEQNIYPEILPGWNLEIEFILNCLDIHFDVTQFHGEVFTLKDLGLNNTKSASGLPGAWLIAIL